MKRLMTLLIAAGLTLGAASAAQAVDIKMSGSFDFVAQWGQKGGNKADPYSYSTQQNNSFYQRFRTQIDIVASEALRGVVMLEVGEQLWGQSTANAGRGAGGGIGADGVAVEVKRAYVDWIPPNTDVSIRMGIQGFANPSFMDDSTQIFDDDVAGVTVSYAFNPNVAVTAWWLRPFSDDNANYATTNPNITGRSFNEMDIAGMALPLSFDGVKVTPWGMWASIGRDAFNGYSGPTSTMQFNGLFPAWQTASISPRSTDGQGNGWWGGLTGEITLADPFRFAWDANYGSVDMGRVRGTNEDVKRAGWYAAMLAEYKFDMVTPGIVGWYGSGDDANWRNGSEMMPTIAASSKFTSFGQDGAGFDMPGTGLATGLSGTWGVMGQLKDITLLEDLSHTVRVAYYQGTNDKDGVKRARRSGTTVSPWMNSDADTAFLYMTDKDNALEFNLDSTYKIYENLSVGMELGYIRLDIDESVWGRQTKNQSENMYKVAVGMNYSF